MILNTKAADELRENDMDASWSCYAPSLSPEEERALTARDRYLGKFSGVWMDIELALIALDVLAQFDSAAREAHNRLSDALADSRHTVESNV